jgi:hypothetical protein
MTARRALMHLTRPLRPAMRRPRASAAAGLARMASRAGRRSAPGTGRSCRLRAAGMAGRRAGRARAPSGLRL